MSNLLPIQILFAFFLIFAVSRVILRAKEGNIRPSSFLFWIGIWVLAGFSILQPEFTTYLAKFIGIGRGTDAVIYASIAVLFYLIFRTNVMMEDLRHEINKLAALSAIKGIGKSASSSQSKTKKK